MTQFARSATVGSFAILLLSIPRLPAAAIPQKAIDRAVAGGVAALKKAQAADGSFSGNSHGSGPTALAAIALLECGVARTDEQIRKALVVVRNDCPTMNRTYNLALAIIFFDLAGDPQDEPIIHRLTLRLLEGQTRIGAWGYTTPEVSAEEATRLRTLIERRTELKTVPGKANPEARPPVDPEIIDRVGRLENRRLPPDGAYVDNSNTQFALLGTWVGRRHGIRTDVFLRRTEAYFRATQSGGRWPYTPGADVVSEPRVANTCSGLLGLAMGTGVLREAQMRTNPERKDGKPPTLRDPLKDPLIQVALNFVGLEVGAVASTRLYADVNKDRNLYFLWSVERVGMVYSVPVMCGVNWYQVGAAAILKAQLPDGSWDVTGGGRPFSIPREVNTSFALLFLVKSNFAADLTTNLKIKIKQTTIHSGDEQKTTSPELVAESSAAERLATELPGAAPERQNAIIADLRTGKGTEFTESLAHVIPKLNGEVQKKARDALAERLARMDVPTIRAKLKEDNPEVRRAAALACAMKEDKAFIPDLIAALDDSDHWVVRSAAVALRTLTGQDLGPAASATAEEQAKAVAAWKAWWKRQNHG